MSFLISTSACLALTLALALAAFDAGATHVSKAIMTIAKLTYQVGETVNVKGWVEYDGKPAADVLLEVRIASPAGSEVLRSSVRADSSGNFALEYRLPANAAPGAYEVEVVSQCNDAHRSICTRQKSSQRLTVHPAGTK